MFKAFKMLNRLYDGGEKPQSRTLHELLAFVFSLKHSSGQLSPLSLAGG